MPTSRLRRRFTRALVLTAVSVLSVHVAPARGADDTVTPVVDRLQLSSEIRARVEEMRRASPTFRQQYQRMIESPQLLLRGRIDPALVGRSFRARTTLVRYTSGLIVASIEIGPGGQQAEWIAHEFEHVLERLEGMDLPALAQQRAPGIWFSGGDMIETNRAVRAGRAVIDEMRRRDQRSDNLVQ